MLVLDKCQKPKKQQTRAVVGLCSKAAPCLTHVLCVCCIQAVTVRVICPNFFVTVYHQQRSGGVKKETCNHDRSMFQCKLPFTAGLQCQAAVQALICPLPSAGARGCMAENRAEAICHGVGKTLSSSPDLGISLGTVSIYQHVLLYPNTHVKKS